MIDFIVSVVIASVVLYIKDHLRFQTEITAKWEIQKKEFEKGKTYFSINCISTPFLAYDTSAIHLLHENENFTNIKW